MSAIAANRELDGLIRDGVPVAFDDADGVKQHEVARLIDFDAAGNNDYLAVSQLWIKASAQAPYAAYRRPDVILYVNGLPLVFIELKNSNVKLRSAFDDNLANYKHDIPQLFHCNAFCLLSNAIETKVGSFTAGWEHFFNWMRVESEKEQVNRETIKAQRTSLEMAAAGLCHPDKLLEDEHLDEAQQQKLERKFSTEMEVIKRDDRLETIAKDIVYHFPRRGYLGKAMVVTLDKFTAVKMYDKVQYHWKAEIKRLRGLIKDTNNDIERARFKKIVTYMKSVEMAVVISDPAADEARFAKAGLDILPHVKRLDALDQHGHDIEYNFKDPEHPLQLVFVCAMWLTGFDAPTVSTLYLDKPMKDHNLMQTIARANRVAAYKIKGHNGQLIEKKSGDIVDYYNVFRNMKKALSDYAQGEEGSEAPPVKEKAELFKLLDDAIDQTVDFCNEREIDLQAITIEEETFKNISLFEHYADILLSRDEWRKSFYVYDNTVASLYEACKPEIFKQTPRPLVAVIGYLRGVIDMHVAQADIDEVAQKIAELLDESVVVDHAEAFTVREHQAEYKIVQKGKRWDLSQIDFEKLKADFTDAQYKNIEIAEMRAFIEDKLRKMLEVNHSRIDFAQRLQEIIDRYNSGGSSTESYFEDLMLFAEGLKDEDQRHVCEGLSEDELELYDMLRKEKLTQAETQSVKLAAKHLMTRLLDEHPKVLVQDWWKDGQTRQKVKSAVEQVLDEDLPDSYDRVLFKEKSDNVYDLIVDFAVQGKKWVA